MQTKDKWDTIHATAEENQEDFNNLVLPCLYRQLRQYCIVRKGKFLEIGCGSAFLGEAMMRMGWKFIGIDFSEVALYKMAKRLLYRNYKNFYYFRQDLSTSIIQTNADLIYGGGVLEHLDNPQYCINECYRVLNKGGVLFNAVPFFNIGNAIYRMQWGGIPNIPVLKQISEFIHIKLLGGKHMLFGYELQFTKRQLINMYKKAGFKTIIVGRFDCYVQMNSIKNPWLKKKLIKLSETNPHFWAMLKVIGVK